jgi:heptosyltransferase-1
MDPPLAERDFARVLLIKPSSLGDVIHALPILGGLRGRYPSAHIAWLVATPFVDLLDGHPALNEVIPFDRKRYGRIGRSLFISAEFARFVTSLRRRRFDLVLDLQGLFRSGFLAWCTRACVRIGPGDSREMAGVFYTHRYPVDSMETHAVKRMWAVAGLLGFDSAPRSFQLPITESDRSAVRRALADSGIHPDREYAVVFPAARWETKVWPADRFAAVIDRMAAELHLPAVLAGSASERPACDSVAAKCGGRPANLAGATTLRQVAALIDGARLVLTNDSGPMHIADALQRPLVALFGPTNPLRTGPYHRGDSVVRLVLPCSPCYLRELHRCRYGHVCMKDLDANRVFEAVASLLKTRPV